MKNPTIQGHHLKKASLVNWTDLGHMDCWLGLFNDKHFTFYIMQLILLLMEINWILEMIVFGLGLFANDIINLKQQGVGQKMMTGWHNHPKKCRRHLWTAPNIDSSDHQTTDAAVTCHPRTQLPRSRDGLMAASRVSMMIKLVSPQYDVSCLSYILLSADRHII